MASFPLNGPRYFQTSPDLPEDSKTNESGSLRRVAGEAWVLLSSSSIAMSSAFRQTDKITQGVDDLLRACFRHLKDEERKTGL